MDRQSTQLLEQMKVLYYLYSFPKLSQSFVLNEIYELFQRGHDIVVCAFNEPAKSVTHTEFDKLSRSVQYVDEPTYTEIPELLTRCLHRPHLLENVLYWDSPVTHSSNILRANRAIDTINQLEWEPEHVHTHFAQSTRYGARHVASHYDVPYTVTTHAADLYEEPLSNCVGPFLRNASRIVTISEYNRRYIRTEFTADTPVDIVRAGIRPEKFEPTEDTVENRIFTVARFVEKKGLEYALEAVSIAAEEIPNLEYHIVGSGPRESQLQELVHEFDIDDNVEFLDNVSDDRLIQEFDRAQCFLLPCVIAESGNRDGIPVAIMEAMAMKTPPVTTTVSGIPELVDHEENGLLVEPRDPEATAEAILHLLRNDSDRVAYAAAARETVKREFNISKEAEKLAETFQKAQLDI